MYVMQKAIIGIGLPASGKTTVLRSFASRHDYTYVCVDDIRAGLTGKALDMSRNREVWDLVRQKASEAIKKGDSVVIDATFTKQEIRRNFIAWLRQEGVKQIQGLYISTPFEIAKGRNANRSRVVPDEVLERTKRYLATASPDIADGLDALFVLDENYRMIKAEIAKEGKIISKEMRIGK